MFVLRRVTSDLRVNNECLGEDYSIIRRNDDNGDFDKLADLIHPDYTSDENIFGVLIANKGTLKIPLYKKSKYFVMSENGSTFEKIA